MTVLPRSDESVTGSPVSLVNVKSGAGSPSSSKARTSSRRAVGVVRVSRVGERDGDRFVSPAEQRERIEAACERDGLALIEVVSELDVSGGAALESRHGLRAAIERIEAGEAEVLIVAYLDRLVRSLTVQAEIIERVERAGGAILAVDVGALSNGSAGSWLSGTMLGAVAEYHRRVTAERTADAKRRAIERGVAPYPNVPPGYRRRKDGTLTIDRKAAPAVTRAFEMRANGATIREVREHLRAHGIERSYHGVQALLRSRVVLGELRFGDLVNESAHPPIVDRMTWARVQRVSVSRGRRPSSDRLLARLGVLRCGSCGARMVVGTSQGSYGFYRCPPVGDCERRVTISAEIAERAVVEETQRLLARLRGSATASDELEQAKREAQRRQDDLDAAIRAFAGLEGEQAARERLEELRALRDAGLDRVAEFISAPTAVTVTAADWDLLTLDERRGLIRAVIAEVVVAPGRGSDRITVHPRGE